MHAQSIVYNQESQPHDATRGQMYGYELSLGGSLKSSLAGLHVQKVYPNINALKAINTWCGGLQDGYVECCTPEACQLCRTLLDMFDGEVIVCLVPHA